MKAFNIIPLFALLVIAISCQHDDAVQSGNVQFSFSEKSSGNISGRKQTDAIPDGVSLLISLSKSNGDTVFTWKEIDLLKIGDQFITDPLPLMPGGYIINDFIIRSSANTLLFIAPKAGSPLAALVKNPLPISFTVNANAVANTLVEVVDVNHQNPEDFGYAAFPIKLIPGSGFPVSAFILEEGQAKLTTAKAYILHEHDTLLKQNLRATVDNVNWSKDGNDRFTLVIIKDGYARYQKNFSLDSMITHLDGKPLPVVLQPAFTISWTPWRANDDFLGVHIGGTGGAKITIDWGDGSIQQYEFIQDGSGEINHTYADPIRHFMSVTGDLAAINLVGFYYQSSKIDTLSIVHLPNLKDFSMSFFASYYGRGVDFSHNPELKSIDFSYLIGNLNTLDISKNPTINALNLQFLPLPTPVVDKVIDDLLNSVVLHDTRNGVLNLIAVDYTVPVLIGPPSDNSMNKLYALINDYGWQVYPITIPY